MTVNVHFETPGGTSGGGGGPTPPAGPAPQATPPAAAPGGTPPTPAPGTAPGVAWDVEGPKLREQLDRSNKELDSARKEAAGYRTQNRGQLAEFVKVLAPLAGVTLPSDPSTPADPQAVLAQFQKRDAERENQLRSLKIDNALVGVFAKHGVDAEMTRAMLLANGTLASADPDADDFKTSIDGAVKKLIEQKPTLKTAVPPGAAPPRRSTAPMPPAGAPVQYSREDIQAMSGEEINKAREAGQLDELLGRRPRSS